MRNKKLEELKDQLLKCQEEAIRAQVKVEGVEGSIKSIYLHISWLEEKINSLDYKLSEAIASINRLRDRLEELEERLEKQEHRVE